jgi:hypothetical protein
LQLTDWPGCSGMLAPVVADPLAPKKMYSMSTEVFVTVQPLRAEFAASTDWNVNAVVMVTAADVEVVPDSELGVMVTGNGVAVVTATEFTRSGGASAASLGSASGESGYRFRRRTRSNLQGVAMGLP